MPVPFGHEIRWVLDHKSSKPETKKLQVLVGNQEWQDVQTVILSEEDDST